MNKKFRLIINIFIFAMVVGFIWYMAFSLGKQDSFSGNNPAAGQEEGISPYRKTNTLRVKSDIISFALSDGYIYIAVNQAVLIYDKAGKLVKQIPVDKEIRDIQVADQRIYLLYPAEIEVWTVEGQKVAGWEARRKNSGYCSMVLSSEYIYVTDAENKNICQYTKEGEYMAVFFSPDGFILPSYAFDIIIIRDTIYCSNSGRHRIESYTLEGQYIASFGKAGNEAGAFAGCCNPAFLAATTNGDIVTSEKGNPRLSCFGRDGRFRTILLGSKKLGGGVKAYRVEVQDDRIYVAGKNTLSEFVFDPLLAAQSACAGCPVECPLRKGMQ